MQVIKSAKAFSNFLGLAVVALSLLSPSMALACTGLTLTGQDGTVSYGRTVEWGPFEIGPRLEIIPRKAEYASQTLPDGQTGITWTAKYGAVATDGLQKEVVIDGIIATVEEVRQAMAEIRVVPVVEPTLGFPAPFHWIVTEPDGDAIVIEYMNGELNIFENELGVITNSPNFDWHLTNLRNYLNLSAISLPSRSVGDLDFSPLGAGSGMLGLPGDFTPVSRFVRAVAFSQTARPTDGGFDMVREVFRILDNFNIPLGAAEEDDAIGADNLLYSATQWTTAYDQKDLVFYYHTQYNRNIRSVDLKQIDFGNIGTEIILRPLDTTKEHPIEDVTPTFD